MQLAGGAAIRQRLVRGLRKVPAAAFVRLLAARLPEGAARGEPILKNPGILTSLLLKKEPPVKNGERSGDLLRWGVTPLIA